ncbi:MAG: hypothetical protein B6U69_03875 [Thermofilum sp. ex4484_15]|nr:MAG: hypothetical protein B6U69_03875 [Thermofilum sp. ex4484_15]
MEEVIRVTKLFKKYRRRTALRGLSFKVHRASIHALLGPNGAGKSTALKAIVGLIKLDGGEIEVLGVKASEDERKVRELIGYVPENPPFPKCLSAEEVLDIYGRIYGMSKAERRRMIKHLLELVGLSFSRRVKIGKYSKGMIQRLALAQALINDPPILIMDEPTSGLDPEWIIRFKRLIKQLRRDGKSILFSSHLLYEAKALCDEVTVIYEGKALFSGPLRDFLSKASRGITIRLEVRPLKPSLVDKLRSLPFVREVGVEGSSRLIIEIREGEDHRLDIVKILYNMGCYPLEVVKLGPSIEEAYLKIVGRG